MIGRFINADDSSIVTVTLDGLTDKNLYAYCDNNPVFRVDENGAIWNIIAGAAVNLFSSWFSAVVTGQEYTLRDAIVDTVAGAVGAMFPGGWILSGLISGGYSAYSAWESGASTEAIALCGITSGLTTAFTMSTICSLSKIQLDLMTTLSLDLVFGTESALMNAAITKSVLSVDEIKDENANEKNKGSLAKHFSKNVVRRNARIGEIL